MGRSASHSLLSFEVRRSGSYGNDPRYNKTRCFEPFPFPLPPNHNATASGSSPNNSTSTANVARKHTPISR